MPVRCGHCKGTHPTAADVRRCFEGTLAEREPAPPAATSPPLPATTGGDIGELAGPAPLGRWLLVRPGAVAPAPWATARRIALTNETAADRDQVYALRRAWHERERVVVEISEELDALIDTSTAAWTDERFPWELEATFEPLLETLAHVITANSVDLRDPRAPRSRLVHGELLVDGGPLRRFTHDERAGRAVVPRVHVERDNVTPLGEAAPRAELAADQLAAVAHDTAVARIIAPAGSGKTRVLTERARHLLREWQLDPSGVTLLAYNKRAEQEMKARTRDLPELRVQTLNALGLAIVTGSGRFKRRASQTVIDERDVRRHLNDLVKLPQRTNTDPYQPWIDALAVVRLGLRDPADVEDEFDGDVDGFADVFPLYRERLRHRGELDFDEQIAQAIEVLLREPDAREIARRACRVLLVDEFQDLTPAHLLLIRLLAGPDGCVFGVGDDDQTIYGYSGASPRWLIDYGRIFPGAGDHPLTINYRCPAMVVRAASNLLTRNRVRVPKEIRPAGDRAGGGPRLEERALDVRLVAQPVVETRRIVEELLTGSSAARPDEVAVLTRVNASLPPVKVLLAEEGIPSTGGPGSRWLQRTGVRSAIAWLRIANDPDRLRADDLREAVRRPSRGCSSKLIDWIAEQRTLDRLRALARRVNDRDALRVEEFVDDIVVVAAGASEGPAAVLTTVRHRLGLDTAMASLDANQRAAGSSHLDDLDALIALAPMQEDIPSFLSWITNRLDTPDDPDGVRLSTVHAVKGLEWPHVVVHDANDGLFPHRLAVADVEEERRVFHVALTRCSTSVALVAAANKPSPFLAELDEPGEPKDPPARVAPAAGEPPRPRAGATGAGAAPGDPRLRDALKAWRIKRSQADKVPAFVVFSNATLDELARRIPRTLPELSRVKGFGPVKLERYGDEVLGVITDAID